MGPLDVLGFVLVFCVSLHGIQGADVWTIEGDSPILPCGITYDPEVNLFWTLQPENIIILFKRPDGTVEVLEKQWEGRVEFLDGKRLRIRNVSRQDDSSAVQGEYRCSQGSRAGERSHLHVRHPPSSVAISGYNSSSPLYPGDDLKLSCGANDSNPAPSYAWYKNGIKIGPDDRTVNINPVKLENNGDVIRCKVTVHDDRDPVFHWEGQSQVRLSVRSREAGTNYGVVVGIPVAVAALLVAGVGLEVYFRRKPSNRKRSTNGTAEISTEGPTETEPLSPVDLKEMGDEGNSTEGSTEPEPKPPVDLKEVWDKVFDIVKPDLHREHRKQLGRKLNLSEVDINAIEEKDLNSIEKLQQVLLLWRERNPYKSPADLAAALRECHCDTVADMVEECWDDFFYVHQGQ